MLRFRSPHALVSCTYILCTLLSVGMSAQPRFDTQIANANGKVFTNINQNLIDILTANGGLFDRSRRYFDVGLNWDGLDNKHAKTILGVTIMDDHIEHLENGVNPSSNINRLTNCPPNARFIAIEGAVGGAKNLLDDMGYSASTRVDFELNVNDQTDEPDLETGTNTGALHGFDTVGNGTVNGKHVELRRSQGPSVYADNSNQRIWSTTSAREHKRNNDAKIDVYPFTSSGGSYPANPLPLWTWNEESTGRPDLNPNELTMFS